MGDRRISRRLEGNMLSSCVTPAYSNALETIALTEKRPEKVQVCEKQPGKTIVGVKRADKRKMDKIRVKDSFKNKFMKSRPTWGRHVENKWMMKNWQREQMPRNWKGNGGEEDRKSRRKMGKVTDRRKWRLLTENVVREK